jgi:NAD(P)H-dependent flavin oxidoreductase YrpB (nitropropane dioxygenase family)
MYFDNVLTRMLGVKYPIIQGAFGWPGTGTSKIAVPAAEAGALGILTTICYSSPDEFAEDVKRAKSLTDKPFAVNFSLLKGTKYDNEFHEPFVKITMDEGIRTVFTSAYDGSYIGRRFKERGCNWIHKCATLEHAISISQKGVDAIVIVGREGTGYKNPHQNTTLINMTMGRRLIGVPLIAAGGLADARGFMAALAMGASGVYLGTAFMATEEFQIPLKTKAKIVEQDILDTEFRKRIYEMEHSGRPSLAAGLIDSVKPVKQYIEELILGAEEIMAEFERWGMMEV